VERDALLSDPGLPPPHRHTYVGPPLKPFAIVSAPVLHMFAVGVLPSGPLDLPCFCLNGFRHLPPPPPPPLDDAAEGGCMLFWFRNHPSKFWRGRFLCPPFSFFQIRTVSGGGGSAVSYCVTFYFNLTGSLILSRRAFSSLQDNCPYRGFWLGTAITPALLDAPIFIFFFLTVLRFPCKPRFLVLCPLPVDFFGPKAVVQFFLFSFFEL